MAEGSNSTTSSKDSSTSIGIGMKTTIKVIRAKYSKVKDVTTETLDGWLHRETKSDQNVVLMDCRDECEYSVSHLAGARRVDWENGDPQQLLDSVPCSDKPCTIVCYCSVGYRSSALADRLGKFLHLSQKGKSANAQQVQVFNLEGSIFKWANEGRPMVNSDGQPTVFCHPYNAIWGRMLNKDIRYSDASSKNSN